MKKFVAIVLSIMLVLSTVAFAEEVASKTSEDMIVVTTDNPAIEIVVEDEEETGDVADAIAAMSETMLNNESPITYFEQNADAETVDAIKDVFGDEEFVVSEGHSTYAVLNGLDAANVDVTITFPTAYTPDQKIALAIGVKGTDDKMDWTIVPASANEDGAVIATISKELVQTLSEKTGVMFVLNTPAA